MADQAPTVGRIVHYQEHLEASWWPAIVTRVDGDMIAVTAFPPPGEGLLPAQRRGSVPELGSEIHERRQRRAQVDPRMVAVRAWRWPPRAS